MPDASSEPEPRHLAWRDRRDRVSNLEARTARGSGVQSGSVLRPTARERFQRCSMSFRGVFIALVLGTGMIVAAFMLQAARPRHEVTGECRRWSGRPESAPSATARRRRRSSTSMR